MFLTNDLDIIVDQNSWPTDGSINFPNAFVDGSINENVEVLSILMLLGLLTTPVQSVGLSLSEHWAWVRYLNAMSDDPSFSITKAFSEMDPHQKTILSDDFGVGISMYWLAEKLNLKYSCDGKYFADRLAEIYGVGVTGKAKNGPRKSPDFVCIDDNGNLHVIECKGTQQNESHRNNQLYHMDKKGKESGAVVQKKTIILPSNPDSQRLGAGVFIAAAGSGRRSSLKVVDPVPDADGAFKIDEKRLQAIHDPLIRSAISRTLSIVGLPVNATSFASPNGGMEMPIRVEENSNRRGLRQEFLRERNSQADLEIERIFSRPERIVNVRGEKYFVREQIFDLPRGIELKEKRFSRVRVKAVLQTGIADLVSSRRTDSEPILKQSEGWKDIDSALSFFPEEFGGILRVGSGFEYSIELLRQSGMP